MELRKYHVPEVIIGDNSLNLSVQLALKFNAEKILLVTDDGVIKAGWVKEVEERLKEIELPYVLFKDVTPNPKDYEVAEGAKIYDSEQCNLIIAIGGGSVIDCAKGIGIVSSNNNSIHSFEGVDNVRIPMPPLICIPTTAGSSADVSQFAIIIDSQLKKKMAIISKALVPDVSLIDGVVTTTMDSTLTASTGMDAMVHAIEAYVSNASSILTDLNAIKAIELLSQNLLGAVQQPDNLGYRNNVMMGSMLAGMAFSNASLGIVHAMAHSLGGIKDLPHGECNAILLKSSIEVNFDSCPERYKAIYIAMGGDAEVEPDKLKDVLIAKIDKLKKSLGIEDNFKSYQITDIDFEQLAANAYNDPCLVTNPKSVSQEQIETIFRALIV